MENHSSSSKIPLDSTQKADQERGQEMKDLNTNNESNQKILEEENKIKSEEDMKKINEKKMLQEAQEQKIKSIMNFLQETNNILSSIISTWENYREGYNKYFTEELKPKFNEFLSYPCITSFQDKAIIIYIFLCKYFLIRMNHLKEIPKDEIYHMINIVCGQNYNLFSIQPTDVNNQDYELINDKFFYDEFKRILPDKEIENSYIHNNKNCLYKYFIEFIFQSGFIDNYIKNILLREDLLPSEFGFCAYFPQNLFYLCDSNFIRKKNWNILIIKIINQKINFFNSDQNPHLKNEFAMYYLVYYISNFYFDSALGLFNNVIDDLLANHLNECQTFAIVVFRLNENYLKHQKINTRMTGIQFVSNLCDNYLNFANKTGNYYEYKSKYENAEKTVQFLVKMGIEYLAKINIFDIIFGENIHEGMIQRSYSILSLLYKAKVFNSSHIQILWNLSQTKYQSISTAIISLFGHLLPEFSNEDCNSILTIVDKMKFKEVNDITLKLLENFFHGNTRHELLLNILFKFSNELSYEQGLDKNIIHKSRAILMRLLMNKNYLKDLFEYIKKGLFYIHKFYLPDTYLSVFQQIFDFLENQKDQKIYENFNQFDIKNFFMFVSFWDNNYKLFPILMNYLLKIFQIFTFFYSISIKIINEINQGNFDYDNLLNIDTLYSEYIVFCEGFMNFNYSLIDNNKNIEDKKDDSMDIDMPNNPKNNNNNIFILDKEFYTEIKSENQVKYIKKLINDFSKFFKESIIATNTIPNIEGLKNLIFQELKIGFQKFSYNDYINHIIRIILQNISRSNSNFKASYINFLYQMALQTNNVDPSLNWYYTLLNDIFDMKINKNFQNLIDDETMQTIIKSQILNSDYKILPLSAFNAVFTASIYINQKISIAVYSPLIQKFTEIKSFKTFWGFNTFWNFYIYTKNPSVYNSALNLIINIFELTSKKEEDRNQIINTIFGFISKSKNNLRDNPDVKTSFLRILKVISVVLGTKVNKDLFNNNNNNNGNNVIRVICKNFYFDSNNQEEITINISIEQKINSLKEFIINNVICTQANLDKYNKQVKAHNEAVSKQINNRNNNNLREEEKMDEDLPQLKMSLDMDTFKKMVYGTNIIINYKNAVLKDDYTVADYHMEENAKLLILKGGGYTEEEFVPSEDLLTQGYSIIRDIFGENLYFGEDIMKASIIKHKGDLENAGIYLTDPENVKILQRELDEKKSKMEQKHDDIICLDEEKIKLLIEVLNNNNDSDIEFQIWELFSSIKYPENVINGIIEEQLDQILNIENMNKFILFLEIINSLIFGGEFCKYNKLSIEQKNAWISNFIRNEELIKKIFVILQNLDKNTNINISILYKILKIFIGWFHKILFKINEVITNLNKNIVNALPEIKMLRNFYSHDNIINNDTNEQNGAEANKENNNDEFKDINSTDGLNFLSILDEVQSVLIFYKLINLIIQFNDIEVKKILLQKITEFILINLTLQKKNIPNLCLAEKKNKLFIKIIFQQEYELDRKIFKNFLKVLIRHLMTLTEPNDIQTGNNIFTIIFQSMIKEILSGGNFNNELCDIFSHLLVYSTNNIIEKEIEHLIYNFLESIYKICINIDNSNIQQINLIRYEVYIIYGCLQFYKNIIINYINNIHKGKNNYEYIEFLYDFLFSIEKNKNTQRINSNKFKDNFLRNYLLSLLTELISSDNNYLNIILPKVIKHHIKLEKNDPNKIETPFDVNIRSPQEKLIGLRNFGSTCYLNSLTQQLFMMPCFHKDLFNNFIISPKSNDELDKLTYSVIYNLQITFQNLKYGSMSPYPPKRFIKSFLSAFNGEPIQTGIQQDSDEFLSILCDNLEKEAKLYNKENFLENSFKGNISNEILSLEKEYPYYSHGEEPFFRITLDIKGHKSLEEALDAYVKGEILDGDNKYYVDKYKRKISIRKSSSLEKLGNVVIIHLKRFEFDFVTFNNYKLSDYLKFPTEINFKKWTRIYLRLNDNENNKLSQDLLNITEEEKQNLNDNNMDYILTGILVHGGSNLQSGHYYSYIMDQETGNWYQFNDNTISDYNIKTDLEKECFGNVGENTINQYGRTAYLLFYTKKSLFKNKTLLENININKTVLDDVYNENVKFLNMNIYLNPSYFNFLEKFCINGIPLLNEGNQIMKENNLTLSNYLIRNWYIFNKVLSVLKPNNDENEDSIDENIIYDKEKEENNIINMKNFEQVYNKCKEEIDSVMKEEKEQNKKLNNFISKKKLIKVYFNYVFGVILPKLNVQNGPNNNQDFILKVFKTLVELIKANSGYSLWILKQIEKNIPLFLDIIFKYGTTENELSEMAKSILELFQITFDIMYHYEKDNMELSTDIIKYFIKNDQGKFIIVKEYRSIVMRLIKKLFCDNLEKSRTEYSRNSLFLIIFHYMVKSYPETACILVNYFFTLISLITNNKLNSIKSESNPNYFMGGNATYQTNINYMSIFSDTILRCVTPGMKNSGQFSPYFSYKKRNTSEESYFTNWLEYPQLPKNWEKILSMEFYIHYILEHPYSRSKEITGHLSFNDEKVSIQILKLICEFTKTTSFVPLIEKVFNNVLCVFDLKDNLEIIRADALFELNDNNINEEPIDMEFHKNLFDYLEQEKNNSMKKVLLILYNIGKAIENYEIVAHYFENYKSKLAWIGTFIFNIKNDQNTKDRFVNNCGYILNQHPDLLKVIQENLINRYISS